MMEMAKLALGLLFLIAAMDSGKCQDAGGILKMYVDELPQLPKLYGDEIINGKPSPGNLTVGMYPKKWKFHRDLPASTLFVYGTSASTATYPGPVIEALQGIPTHVTWENHLPRNHILPWDPTVPTAIPKKGGVPTVVHLHGGAQEPQSDGSALAWFTADFKETGPMWTKPTYTYPNVQHPGNLWYHDHAVGLTRENLLAGLVAPYVIRNPRVESRFNLPSGQEFDRHLVIADRRFNVDGSIYMNATGINPTIHPQWQPEYFGDAMTVNGKVWPYMKVQRRRYRFRILNASNARYLKLALSNGLPFTVVGSDTSYLSETVTTKTILVAVAEIFDVVIDFSGYDTSTTTEIQLTNHAPYPFPDGTPAALPITKVMKFVVTSDHVPSEHSKIPKRLVSMPGASAKEATVKRYIVLYELLSKTGKPIMLNINRKKFEDPVTETPKSGSTEVWEVINLTNDDHPFHMHLAAFQAIKMAEIVNLDVFSNCMTKLNDAVKCNIDDHAAGKKLRVPMYERTWKNVVKAPPGYMTTMVVKFNLVENNAPYPFDATAEPGYVYHCHILDHEDNAMIRPLKLVK